MKTAIVTGGGQGIGKAIAFRFANEGINVVIAENDEEAGRETAGDSDFSGKIHYINCDVAIEKSVKNMVELAVRKFNRIDILINNAAIGNFKPYGALTFEEWNRVISVNLGGAFLCTKYAAPFLKRQSGSVINISSTRAFMSEANTEAYSASKGGIHALTHAFAISLGPKIRVNCISPGWIDVTAWKKSSLRKEPELREADHYQHPAGRVGKPEDIAALASFLVSDESRFITGANFMVDGGMTRKMIYED